MMRFRNFIALSARNCGPQMPKTYFTMTNSKASA
jgi:hypothetical protein